MNAHIKRKIRKLISPLNRLKLKNRNFSILSNNCWGGVVYDKFGLQYLSPTIGAFFFAEDYIKFLKRIDFYLKLELQEIDFSQSKYIGYLSTRLNHCVVGKIGDIEIFFLHYDSFLSASKKREKRKNRINFDNLIVKFSDQNLFSKELFYEFDKLDFKNKIFITTNTEFKSNNTRIVYLKDKYKFGYAKDDIKPSFRKLNLKKYLNWIKENNNGKQKSIYYN